MVLCLRRLIEFRFYQCFVVLSSGSACLDESYRSKHRRLIVERVQIPDQPFACRAEWCARSFGKGVQNCSVCGLVRVKAGLATALLFEWLRAG